MTALYTLLAAKIAAAEIDIADAQQKRRWELRDSLEMRIAVLREVWRELAAEDVDEDGVPRDAVAAERGEGGE